MENIEKRLKAVEDAVGELRRGDFSIMTIMAIESCEIHYHVSLLFQKGEEIKKYVEIWKKRLADTTQEIEQSKTIGDVITVRDKFIRDISDYVRAVKVDSADKAMEIAHSYIKKYSPVALPLKAVKEDNVWIVDIDVGALAVKIAKVKIDARTGDILSYDIPQRESKEG